MAAKRGGYGEERYEKVDLQKRVRDCFLELKDHHTWALIDAARAPEELAAQVLTLAEDTIAGCQQGRALMTLWPGGDEDSVYE